MPRFAANLSMMFGEVEFLDRFAAAQAAIETPRGGDKGGKKKAKKAAAKRKR